MPYLLFLAVALVPAAVALVGGRMLRADSPLLPEQLMKQRGRQVLAAIVAFVLELACSHPELAALAVLGALAGAYPARRRLFGETWSLGACVLFNLRLQLFGLHYWIALIVTPQMVTDSGSPVLAGAVAILVLAALLFARRPLLRLLGARPMERPDLLPHFLAVSARSRVPGPVLLELSPKGAVFANAFALPHRREPAVLFSGTLLDNLAAEELAAVHAHEVAHLEQYQGARLLRDRVVTVALALAAAAGVPALVLATGPETRLLLHLWPVLLLVVLALDSLGVRAREAAADERAVELCRDPEALVRGLVKLHALAQVPRRLGAEAEQSSTHPSLARRIQAIRAAAQARGMAAPAPEQSVGAPAHQDVAAPCAQHGSWVVLQGGMIHWVEGVPAETASEPTALRLAARRVRSHAPEDLAALHLVPGKVSKLVATDTAGQTWTTPIPDAQLPALQAALDRLDTRFGGKPSLLRLKGPAAALVLASLALVLGWVIHFGGVLLHVLLIAALLLRRTTAGAFAALAGTLATLALATVVHPELAPIPLLGAAGFAVLAALAFWLARLSRSPERERTAVLLVPATMAAVGAVSWLGAIAQPSALRLHLGAAGTVFLPAALGALAAVLLVRRTRASMASGILAALLVVALLGASTPRFRDTFVRDAFVAPMPSLAPLETVARVAEDLRLEGSVGEVLLAPRGAAYAYRGLGAGDYDDFDADEAPPPSTRANLTVATVGKPQRVIRGHAIAFVDGERFLLVDGDPAAPRLQVRSVDSSMPIDGWEAALPSVPMKLAAEPGGRWHALIHRSDGWVRVSGTIGSEQTTSTALGPARPMSLGAGTGSVLVVESDYRQAGTLATVLSGLLSFGVPWMPMFSNTISLVGDRSPLPLGRSELMARCVGTGGRRFEHVCMAAMPRDTLFLTGITADGIRQPLGTTGGNLAGQLQGGPSPVLSGWDLDCCVHHEGHANRQLIIDADTGLVRSVRLPAALPPVYRATSNGQFLAGVVHGEGASRLVILRLEQTSAAGAAP